MKTQTHVDAAWEALKERCCADPNAKKIIMLSEKDFKDVIASIISEAENDAWQEGRDDYIDSARERAERY